MEAEATGSDTTMIIPEPIPGEANNRAAKRRRQTRSGKASQMPPAISMISKQAPKTKHPIDIAEQQPTNGQGHPTPAATVKYLTDEEIDELTEDWPMGEDEKVQYDFTEGEIEE